MVWDSYFIEEDFKKGWGHSTWKQGIEIAHEADIEHILMAHYNSEYTDSFCMNRKKLPVKIESVSFQRKE